MRLVLDTNVAVSGLLWGGAPAQLLDATQIGEIELFTSPSLLAELAGILARVKFAKALAATGLPREELVLGYAELATIIVPADIPPTIAADPDDDQVLACALAARADLIVSGDRHLHSLGSYYQGIAIVHPAEALHIIEVG
ncbi:putative toxin-antitoxin system toxin component, PIN family protein [Betaproteobacteria bacterium]|nr:putative toxin-antitoxin system toxin component, PIN family protein [Betaproteobacteria bacterium]